jgi:uncharacterized protein (TIGR00725 family)
MTPQTLIGVIGSRDCDADTYERARRVGELLAKGGFGLICGGLSGVMEAACKGASEAGGTTVGVLPGEGTDSANPYVQLRIATGMGIARNVIIVRSSAAVIALSGGAGTLSEIAHCLQLGVPVVGLNTHDVSPEIIQVSTPEEAVERAAALAGRRDRRTPETGDNPP